jgi:probable phosphoglycerate mutase
MVPMSFSPDADPLLALLSIPPLPGERRVLLVRHGQTAWNVEGRFLGRSDIPLDEVGEDQAERLATRLRALPLAALWSSPLSRAAATAEGLLWGRPHLQLHTEPRLVELDQGELEGRLARELMAERPALIQAWRQDPASLRLPGGEPLLHCLERSRAALDDIAQRSPPGLLAIVGHQISLTSLICHLSGLPLTELRHRFMKNTAVSVLEGGPGAWRLLRHDDAAHLGWGPAKKFDGEQQPEH